MDNKQNKKTVILLTIDALRSDHLQSYGYHRNTAPYLEKFIQNGSIFLNAITNGPDTPSSFSAIFTSILPFLSGGYSPLPSQKLIFPQILKENKIFTYGIHSNPNLGRLFNYNRGFDIFLDGERYKVQSKKIRTRRLINIYIRKVLNYKLFLINLPYRLKGFIKIKSFLRKKIPNLTDILLPFTPMAYNAPYIVKKSISFLKDNKNPLFFWAHFMDVHGPYNPPPENVLKFSKIDINRSEREFLNNKILRNDPNIKKTSERIRKLKILYDSEINFMDENLAKLLNFLRLRFIRNCLLIITSDHGEAFFEHEYSGHQGNIFDEVLKVPLFITEIGKKFSVQKVQEAVQLIDIAPTILDYFGIKIPEYFQGKSLLPLLENKSLNRKTIVISEGYQKDGIMKRNNKEGYKLLSIRSDDWKYIFDEEKSLEYLFNIKYDFLEKNNLINENPSKLSEFRDIKEEHLRKISESDEITKILFAISDLDLNFKIKK